MEEINTQQILEALEPNDAAVIVRIDGKIYIGEVNKYWAKKMKKETTRKLE